MDWLVERGKEFLDFGRRRRKFDRKIKGRPNIMVRLERMLAKGEGERRIQRRET